MAKLVLHLPDGSMRDVKLDRDRLTIGRRPDNDLHLSYPAVSADHAEIVTVGADSFLHDLGSTNGTLVNGERVTKHFLRDHDRIDIGRQHLVYLVNEAETIEALPPDVVSEEMRRLAESVSGAKGPTDECKAALVEESDSPAAPVDDLLADLMDRNTASSVAVDMSPTVSVVPAMRSRNASESPAESSADATGGAFIEVMNGPNAGQITPMTKAEFVFGKAGATIAVIRRVDAGYRLLPVGGHAPHVNGHAIALEGAQLAFGDMIEVGGVKLRFGRRDSL